MARVLVDDDEGPARRLADEVGPRVLPDVAQGREVAGGARAAGFVQEGERERAGGAVGDPRRVIAGTDCGFDTSAGLGEVADEIVWEKLRALRAGAELATRRLLG